MQVTVEVSTCRGCRLVKPLDEFGVSNHWSHDGRNPKCKQCVRQASAEARQRDPDKGRRTYLKYREKYLHRAKTRRDNLPSVQASREINEILRDVYNSERRRVAVKVFSRLVSGLTKEATAREAEASARQAKARRLERKRAKVKAEPWLTHERRAKKVSWASWDEFARFYDEAKLLTLATNVQWDVEHIYPIKSDWVCGLHTPDNLRVVPHAMNVSKALAPDTREADEIWDGHARVFDPEQHSQAWLEVFASTAAGRSCGTDVSTLLWDLECSVTPDEDMPIRGKAPEVRREGSTEISQTAVKRALRGEPPKQVASDLGLPVHTVYGWLARHRKESGATGRHSYKRLKQQTARTATESPGGP